MKFVTSHFSGEMFGKKIFKNKDNQIGKKIKNK